MTVTRNTRFDEIRALATKVAAVHGSRDEALVELRDVVEELVSEASEDPAHATLTELLERARALTGQYEAPAWACGTLRRLFVGLESVDAELSARMAAPESAR